MGLNISGCLFIGKERLSVNNFLHILKWHLVTHVIYKTANSQTGRHRYILTQIEKLMMQRNLILSKTFRTCMKSCRWGRKRSLGTGRFIGNLWSAYGPLMVSWWSLFWQFWSRHCLNHSRGPVWESWSTLFASEMKKLGEPNFFTHLLMVRGGSYEERYTLIFLLLFVFE